MRHRDITSTAPPRGFVQTDLATHEAWMKLTLEKPMAAALMHKLVVLADRDNFVAASHNGLAEQLGVSKISIRRAIDALKAGNWIEPVRLGSSGTVNVYAINSTVAWKRGRDDLRYAVVRGAILLSGSEQDSDKLSDQARNLQQIPQVEAGEAQLPSGPGLPPVSQPALPGMEPDLPARMIADE